MRRSDALQQDHQNHRHFYLLSPNSISYNIDTCRDNRLLKFIDSGLNDHNAV